MVCNGRTLLSDPQWTRVKSHLGHKSIIIYIITDKALVKESSDDFVDRIDVGSSDEYIVWFELGRTFGRREKKVTHVCINGK